MTNQYLQRINQVHTARSICKILDYDFNMAMHEIGLVLTDLNFTNIDLYCWLKYGASYDHCLPHHQQQAIFDMVECSPKPFYRFWNLIDDDRIFEWLFDDEKLYLKNVFSDTTILNIECEESDPINYQSEAAAGVFLYLNLIRLQEQLPPEITKHWEHYDDMKEFAKRGFKMNIETYVIRQLQGYPEWLCKEEAEQAREPPELAPDQFLQESVSNYSFSS